MGKSLGLNCPPPKKEEAVSGPWGAAIQFRVSAWRGSSGVHENSGGQDPGTALPEHAGPLAEGHWNFVLSRMQRGFCARANSTVMTWTLPEPWSSQNSSPPNLPGLLQFHRSPTCALGAHSHPEACCTNTVAADQMCPGPRSHCPVGGSWLCRGSLTKLGFMRNNTL